LALDRLTAFQRQVLEAFFRHENRFFLSGGAALAGFYLGHRQTHDLDLFTAADVLEDGEQALLLTAAELGASIERIQTAPDFRRRLLRRADAGVIVDLVRDRAPQGLAVKRAFGDIRVDPPEEILANKICALLSRSELRDLVDVRALERAGFRVEDALPLASRKDAGLTPAQLAFVLSQIDVGGQPAQRELADYVADLCRRLVAQALPKG